MKIFSFLAVCFLASYSIAATMDGDKTVTFFSGYKYTCKVSAGRASMDSVMTFPTSIAGLPNEKNTGCEKVSNVSAGFVEVSLKSISAFLKPFRDEMCSVVKPGNVKVTLGVDANGKIYGIGVGANGSIEVNIECK